MGPRRIAGKEEILGGKKNNIILRASLMAQ